MPVDRVVLKSVAECEKLQQGWAHLLGQCGHVTPFHTYEWIQANLQSFGNEGICVLAFRDGDSDLIGILPLVLRRGRRHLATRTWLEFAGLPHADYASPLVSPGCEPQVAESFLEFLSTPGRAWDAVFLDKLRADDPFLRALLAFARGRGWMAVRDSHQTRQLSKSQYLQDHVVADIKSLEKARKRLAHKGEVRFEVYDSADRISAQLETFVRLHVGRFAAKRMQSPLALSSHVNFYRAIIRECAPAGYVWLSCLSCAGRPVALRLSLRFGKRLHLYSTCFDQEFHKFSPSMLQLGMLLGYAFQNGITAVDFGGGESPHKEQSGATIQQSLIEVEFCAGVSPWAESRLYEVAERVSRKSLFFQRRAKALRRLLPYSV